MPLLHTARSFVSITLRFNYAMSSSTHCCHVFLGLPLPTPLTLSTTMLLQADTQSSGSLRSTCPNHHNLPRQSNSWNTCNAQPAQQFRICFPVTQLYTAHPSDHHPFSSLLSSFYSLPIRCFHCPYLAVIHQNALYTSPVNFSFQSHWSPPCREDRWEFPKLSPCTFYSHPRCLFSATSETIISPR